jgi:hypothetical protein
MFSEADVFGGQIFVQYKCSFEPRHSCTQAFASAKLSFEAGLELIGLPLISFMPEVAKTESGQNELFDYYIRTNNSYLL